MTPELRDYQRLAVAHLHANPRAALFLDMGLGKTAITLSALTEDHLPAIVFAPKRVAENVWEAERDIWRPDLSISVAKGSPTQRSVALHANADITVIGRDNQADVLAARPSRPWRTVIIDELSGYKGGRKTARWKTARKLIHTKGSAVTNVWGLTGTPIPNGLMDLWAQIYLLDGGERLHPNVTTYRSRYFRPGRVLNNGIVSEWVLREGAEAAIHEKVSDICLSMGTEGRVELPPVTFNDVNVVLPPRALKAYREMRDTLVTTLDLVGSDVLHTAANAAVMTAKLSQVTSGFLYGDNYSLDGTVTTVHREKTSAVLEIVEGTGSPVLVFYRFKEELRALQAALPAARTIDEPGVIADWNAGEVPVLLAHPQSAGHGLNLQHGGHTIVWTSLPWSAEEWDQANKRLARSGQSNPVLIHVVFARTESGAATVDHLIRERLTGKASVQQFLLDHLEAPL